MKPKRTLAFPALAIFAFTTLALHGADLLWDATNIGGMGDGAGTYSLGTWSTANANWDQGADLPRVAWSNTGQDGETLDNAIFAGPYSSGTRTVTIGSDITVNQIQVLTGSTGGNRYDIGASNAQNDFAITFGGSYSPAFPAITGSTTGFLNTNFNAKITGTVGGDGLVLAHGSNITTPATSGRFAFTNGNNDFAGDIVLTAGNLGMTADANFGNAANRIILHGGALFASTGSNNTTVFSRRVVVEGGGIATNANAQAPNAILEMSSKISGDGELTRYAGGVGNINLRLMGDMSEFTGLFDNLGHSLAIETTAQSAGAWKISGGTVRLNTTDDSHIANGEGRSDLLMNGGILDMNGKNETINGLSGPTGTVRNNAADTTSTLTLGDDDADATFGGLLMDGLGKLAVTKAGAGIQTLGVTNSYSGPTTVEEGTLMLGGSLPDSAVSVASGATFGVTSLGRDVKSLSLAADSGLIAPLDVSGSDYLLVQEDITFAGGKVTVFPLLGGDIELNIPYSFILTNGEKIGNPAQLVADFSLNGPVRVSGGAAATANGIEITLTSFGANLVWNNEGGNGTGVWNVDADKNFLNGASADVFLGYDHVTFGPTSPAGEVTLEGTLFPASVTVNSAADFVFVGSGSITGSGTLTKSGTGQLTIDNDNSITGDIMIEQGTLALIGKLGTGTLTIDPDGVLTGTGSAAGPAYVEGTVSPGESIGTLSTGPLSLTGTYVCEIDGADADRIAVTGNVNLTGATLDVAFVNPPVGSNAVILTYTGTRTGRFDPASVPAGYEIDYSVPNLVSLVPAASAFPAGTITFEAVQGYPDLELGSDPQLAGINPSGPAPFTGVNGWSLSTSNAAGHIRPTATSGEYRGGQAVGSPNANTYIGGKLGSIEVTGTNTITFDAPYYGGTQVGLFKDTVNEEPLFNGAYAGMSFGIGGNPARFNYRNAAFGTENFGTGFTGPSGHWFRFHITIGPSIGGQREIVWAMRNLTTGVDYDFDPATEGIQPWSFSVTDAQFGAAPELSDGIWVRTTSSARVDNLRVTAVAPPAAGGFADWALLNGVTGGISGDDDNDGVPNGIEFFMGDNSSGFTGMPAPDEDGTITWPKGAAYNGVHGTDWLIEISPSLAAGSWDPVDETDLEISPAGVSYTLPKGLGRIFARLKVMGPS